MGKLAKTMTISIISLLFIGAVLFIIILYVQKDGNEGSALSIDKMVEYSYDTAEITTDLKDGSFVRIQFKVITDSKEAKDEIVKREFQVNNIVIKELAKMDEKKFTTGLNDLEEDLKQSLNAIMTKGEITDVYTINKILQ